ncbi:MAG: SUMF1/EgtB/PvdO family nonheme iron enzyme [Spirochaetaceae bacterium]|jgi:formylglycine-generating enzyme required for sulfatase activity|nr:SUMF1/EgtB/PvdO family nonheme iron enzyme [Spirochaetaceae bacterium]
MKLPKHFLLFTLCAAGFIACEQPADDPQGAAPAQALLANVTVFGVAGSIIDDAELVISISGQEFLMPIAVDADLSNWITNLPYGLIAYSKELVTTRSRRVTIVVRGTPLEAKSETLALTIPEGILTQYKALPVSENRNARIEIINADATVREVTIEGRRGSAITAREVSVQLFADTFTAIAQNSDLSAWFTNLPAGLQARASSSVSAGANKALVTVSGTPQISADYPLSIVVPAAALSRGADISVYQNNKARFAIFEAGARYASVADVYVNGAWKFQLNTGNGETPLPSSNSVNKFNWSRNEALPARDVTITLHNDSFHALQAGMAVSWIKRMPSGLNAVIKNNVGEGAASVTLTVSGTPVPASQKRPADEPPYFSTINANKEPLSITIPASALASGMETDVLVNENARWYIVDANAILPRYTDAPIGVGRIIGTRGSAIVPVTISIELREDTLNGNVAVNQTVTWITNLPSGLTQKIKTIAQNVQFTTIGLEISGVPAAAPVVTSYDNYLYLKILIPASAVKCGVPVRVLPEISSFISIGNTALSLNEVSSMVNISGSTITQTPVWEFGGGNDISNPDDFSREPGPFYGHDTSYRGNVWQNPLPVTIPDFKIGKYEVTEALWWDVYNWSVSEARGDNKYGGGSWKYSTWPGNSQNAPAAGKEYFAMYNISLAECILWCNARSEKEGKTPVYYTDSEFSAVLRTRPPNINSFKVKEDANGYRVPTRALWAYAARSGAASPQWNWRYSGVNPSDGGRGEGAYVHETAPYMWVDPIRLYDAYNCETRVGLFLPNGAGLYDMAGNLAEKTISPDSWDTSQITHGGAAWNRDATRNRFDISDKPRSFNSSRDIDGFRCISDVHYATP